MSKSFWRASDEQRQAILLMEALGLIHDLGKMSDRFLESQEPSSTLEYEHTLLSDPRDINIYTSHTNIPDDPATKFVQEILNISATKPCAFSERGELTELLKRIEFTWMDEQYNFAELMPLIIKARFSKAANWHSVFGKSMKPGLLIGYLHGIAHIEKEGEPDQHKQPYSSVFRATPFGIEEQVDTSATQELTNVLKNLSLHNIEQITTDQRSGWLMQMKALMSKGLADNRRPHNEISLWDWGFTVATLTKAATTYIFKNGWFPDIENLPFCTLRINLDILDHYTQSDKISDLLGIQQVLNDVFKSVQTLLEETYAFGNQFYRDETGAYYLLPNIFDNTAQTELREEIQVLFPPDLRPQVHFSDPITAGDLDNDKSRSRELVAKPRKQALKQKPINADNNFYLFETEWKEGRPKNAEICTVCGIRPVGYPRHGSQSEAKEKILPWATQQKAKQRKICRICLNRRGRRAEEWVRGNTIWTDEVADDNGRSALFIGTLGLEGWLDGTLLSTIQVTSNTAKNPSPARLYRIAETARAFWKKVTDELMPNVLGQCQFRLELRPQKNNLEDLQKELGGYHAYDLNVDGIVLSVVWDEKNKRFLTTDNLNYFANQLGLDTPEKLVGKLKDKTLEILEPSVFLKSSQPIASNSSQTSLKVSIEEVKWTNDGYQPAISLLTEPSLCLMLIPADKALELTRQVKKEYEQQMGRVRDRLPLSIGLVFCNRRTPIRTVLEAGRAMLNLSGQFDTHNGKGWEDWRLMKKDNSGSPCKLEFDNGITWHIPVVAGDGSKKDDWYPRMYQGDRWEQKQPKHVSDLAVRNDRMPKDKGLFRLEYT